MKKYLILWLILSCFFLGAQEKKFKIRLAHNLNITHPVHVVLKEMAQKIDRETKGRITVQLFPNAILGNDTEMVEQLQKGALDLMKVSASFLEGFSDLYGILSLPYLYRDENHFKAAMRSEAVKEIYRSSQQAKFIGLDFFDSGVRSFYTVNKPIRGINDVKGLKIRVMQSSTTIEAMKLLGVSPVPMAFSEVYTALQQGVLDGAENNPLALVDVKHGEVVKYYSFDEHTRIPDVLIARSDFWENLSKKDRLFLSKKIRAASEQQLKIWKTTIQKAIEEARSSQGVKFFRLDKAPFQKKMRPLIEKIKKSSPKKARLINAIQKIK